MTESNLPPELGQLSAFIDSHIECLAGSSGELRSIALCATKHIFDWALETEESSKPHLGILLATLTETAAPQTRSRARSTSTAQKHSPSSVHKHQKKIDIRGTPLPYLFIEGTNIDQIWQQLDLRTARVCENLQILRGEDEDEKSNSEGDSDNDTSEDEDEAADMDVDDDESSWEGLSDEEDDDGSTAEGIINLHDEVSEDDEDRAPPISVLDAVRGRQKLSPMRPRSQGYSNLDDDFFDLATFNAETSEVAKEHKRKLDLVADEDSAEESVMDLFGSVDDVEANGVGNELFYNDFFEPPLRTQNRCVRPSKVRFHERVSVKKIKAVGKGLPVSSMGDEDSDEEEEDSD